MSKENPNHFKKFSKPGLFVGSALLALTAVASSCTQSDKEKGKETDTHGNISKAEKIIKKDAPGYIWGSEDLAINQYPDFDV